MKYDVFISGSFTTVTPLTYTVPNDSKDKLPRIGNAVYLPSSAIRGKLRRLARDEVIDATGNRLNFTDFFFLTVGGLYNKGKSDAGGEEGEAANESYAIHYIRAAEKINPLISLFGAGPGSPVAIPSKLAVTHAIASLDANHATSMISPCRTDDVRIAPIDTGEIVSDEFFDEYLSHVAGQRDSSLRKKEIADLKRKIRAGQDVDVNTAKLRELEAEQKETAAKTVSISNPGLQYEAINPGVILNASMRVIRATEDELSLLMRAFNRLAANPVFGGRKAAGNGVVAGEFRVSMREHGKIEVPSDAGYFSWSGDGFGFDHVSGKAKEWFEREIAYDGMRFDYRALEKAGKAKEVV